jgi:type I restriction enzyme S subunit
MIPKSVKLGDVCTKITKGTTPTTLGMEFSEVGIPFVRVNNFREGVLRLDSDILFISESTHSALARSVIQGGDVLLSIAGTIGRSCVVPVQSPEANCNQAVCIIRTDCARLDKQYLHRWLNSEDAEKQFAGGKVTGVISNLSLTNVRNLEIPLPPLTEQKRIAGILDAADALRAKRRAALAELDTLLQSTFLDMFGDPVTNPMGWPMVNGEDVCARITVGIVVKPASYYQKEGVPALRSLNVKANRIDKTDLVYISKTDNETTLKKTRIWKGDVVLVRSGQPGTAAIVPEEMDGINAIDILIATPDQTHVLPTYLCHYFNSHGGKLMALGEQRGQIQKHLNVGALKAASIPLPDLELQRRFSSVVESIKRQRERMNTHLAELDTLFSSLQSRAFNGEL